MTYPALASSRSAVFLVAGAGKREMLGRLLDGDRSIPAGQVTTGGDLTVFCDEAALGKAL